MSVFHETRDFLREAETLVIGHSINPKGRFLSEVSHGVLHVPAFLMAGAQSLGALAVRGVLLACVWMLLLWAFISIVGDSGREVPSTAGLFWAGTFFASGSVVLELPSGLLIRNIRESDISALAAHIVGNARKGVSINLLREGVAVSAAAASRRLSFVGWVLGLAWAVMTWGATQWVLAPDVDEQIRSGAISYGVFLVVVFLLLGAVFASYREAHRKLNATIAFAFLEAEANAK